MRLPNLICLAVACVSFAGLSGSASADLIAYEGFANPDVSTGFSVAYPAANGSDRGTDVATTLSYPNLQTSGGARQGGASAYLKADLSSPINGGEVWISYLYKTPASGVEDWTRMVTYNGPDSFGASERWNLGNCFGQGFMVRAGNAGETSSAFIAPVADTTYLLVVKYDFGTAATNDGTISMWVNPTVGGASPDGTPLVATVANDATMVVTGLAISGGTLTQFDEIRVGQTFTDVTPAQVAVPEPSSLALLALGGLALRRRVRA